MNKERRKQLATVEKELHPLHGLLLTVVENEQEAIANLPKNLWAKKAENEDKVAEIEDIANRLSEVMDDIKGLL